MCSIKRETHRLATKKIRKILFYIVLLESFASLSKRENHLAQSYVHNSFEDEFSALNCNINTHYMS